MQVDEDLRSVKQAHAVQMDVEVGNEYGGSRRSRLGVLWTRGEEERASSLGVGDPLLCAEGKAASPRPGTVRRIPNSFGKIRW